VNHNPYKPCTPQTQLKVVEALLTLMRSIVSCTVAHKPGTVSEQVCLEPSDGRLPGMNAVLLAGALVGILLARHISVVLPMRQGLDALPTKDMGVLLVVFTAVCSLVFGLVTLWAGLLLQRRLEPAAAAPRRPISGPCCWQPLEDPTWSPAAAAFAMSGKRGQLYTIPAAGSLAEAAGSASLSAFTMLKVPLLLGSEVHLPVASGRPPMEQLIGSWVAGLQQLPAAVAKTVDAGQDPGGRALAAPLQVSLHACGPPRLVEGVRLVADRLNGRRQSRGGNRVNLNFVGDSFQL